MRILAPIGVGELFDKITILRIKAGKLTDPSRRAHVERELGLLEAVRDANVELSAELSERVDELEAVNRMLWDVEDELRSHERRADFEADFVTLARSVYVHNDRRAALKRQIDELCGSEIVEEKSYGEGEAE